MNINSYKHNLYVHLISALIIVSIYSLGVNYLDYIMQHFSRITYLSICFILYVLTVLYIYIALYHWRTLQISVSSFILFLINFTQLTLYLSAISFFFNIWYYERYIEPIYFQDLSPVSQYRYLILTIISLSFIFGYFFIRIFKISVSNISFWSRPYLKEEIHKILYTWNNSFMGDLSDKIINLLYSSFWFRALFFVMHFILLYFTRLISVGLLIYCIFYQKDFCSFIYLTPLMFITKILSFFEYYLIIFQEGCGNYIRSLISATLRNDNLSFFGIVRINTSSLVHFQLTEEAVLKGYSNLDIDHLAKEWYIQAQLSVYFHVYFKCLKYFNK